MRNNRRNGATGILLHANRDFLPVPEGSEAAVEEAYSRISRDVIDNAVPPEQAARIADLLKNVYRVNAAYCVTARMIFLITNTTAIANRNRT